MKLMRLVRRRDGYGREIQQLTCDMDRRIRENRDPEVYKGFPATLHIIGRSLRRRRSSELLMF
jgi:hypothetical protein